MREYPVWPLTKYSLPQARLDAIAAEGIASTMSTEDRMAKERMNGSRCTCCDDKIHGPASGTPRECQPCSEYA